MKNLITLLLLTFFFAQISLAQIDFKAGYFIDNSGKRINCLIKIDNKEETPVDFQYKISTKGMQQSLNFKSVKEFGIDSAQKYIRQVVAIDRSDEDSSKLSKDREPKFKEEQLFLEVLVKGNADLYHYKSGNISCFFYKTDTIKIEQLIFKNYLNSENKVSQNNGYKKQLLINLKCATIRMAEVETLAYNKTALTILFKKYNNCSSGPFVDFLQDEKDVLYNLTLKPGITYSSFSIINNTINSEVGDFDTKIGARIGIEAEVFIPTRKNNFSFFTEPTFQHYKASGYRILNPGVIQVEEAMTINYMSVEIPLGARYYFILNSSSEIICSGSYILDKNFNSKIDFEIFEQLEIKSQPNFGISVGYVYNRKFSIEYKYHTRRNLVNNYSLWTSSYNSSSVVFGYTFHQYKKHF